MTISTFNIANILLILVSCFCLQIWIKAASERCTAQIEVVDPTGQLTAHIYGKDAEVLLSCTPTDLIEATVNLAPTFVQRTAKLALKNQYLLKIHAYQRRFQGATIKKYNIHQVEVISSSNLPGVTKAKTILTTSTSQGTKKSSPEEVSALGIVEQHDDHNAKESLSKILQNDKEDKLKEGTVSPLPPQNSPHDANTQ